MAGKKLALPQQFYERLSVIIFQETDQLVKHQHDAAILHRTPTGTSIYSSFSMLYQDLLSKKQ